MKKFISSLIIGLITFGIIYLVGCFIEVSFNISTWSDISRILTGCFGFLFSLVTADLCTSKID